MMVLGGRGVFEWARYPCITSLDVYRFRSVSPSAYLWEYADQSREGLV